jgi:uncharacterized RmlC-like cupin family protein
MRTGSDHMQRGLWRCALGSAASFVLMLCLLLLPFRGAAQTPVASRVGSTPLLENDRVRVQRVTVPPGYRDRVSMLQNDIVVIQVTAGEMEVVIGQDKTLGHVDPGKTWYVPRATPHQFSNIGTSGYETVIVFLK